MTEQEYKQCKAKEHSLYFWGKAIDYLYHFANAALLGSAFTLLLVDRKIYATIILLLNLLSILVLVLGNMICNEMQKRWEFYFDKCGEFLCERLKEKLKSERED